MGRGGKRGGEKRAGGKERGEEGGEREGRRRPVSHKMVSEPVVIATVFLGAHAAQEESVELHYIERTMLYRTL